MLKFRRLFLASLLATLCVSPAFSQPRADEAVDRPALLEDAADYAQRFGIGLEAAARRLQLQHVVGDLEATIREKESDFFGGLWIEHEPAFRVVVLFTDPAAASRVRPILDRSALLNLIDIQSARYTLAELEERQTIAHHLATELGVAVDSDINVFENRVEVYAVEDGLLRNKLDTTGLRLPEGVVVIAVPGLVNFEQLALSGGATLSTCTAGFTVRRSTGELGISTAAHCGNTQRFSGVVLPFRGEDQSGNQDVQWHSACDILDVTNLFNSGIGMRAVTGTRHRNNQAIGSLVWKFGRTTGRTFGTIQTRNLRPSSVTSPAATFVRVDGGNNDLSSAGDSGGPWFVEGLAYGTHLGTLTADQNDAIYMPINYISSLGVSVLTADPGPCNQRPNATFSHSITGLRVSFNASGSSDPDGSIVSYRWNFGDGQTSTSTSPTAVHFYNNEETFVVRLTVTDNEGATGTDVDIVPLCPNNQIFCEF